MTLIQSVIQRGATVDQPAAGHEGYLYYDTDLEKWQRDSGSAWEDCEPADGSGMANPMTTAGDMVIGGSSGTPDRLAIGSTGYFLTVVSGAPAWALYKPKRVISVLVTDPNGDAITTGDGKAIIRINSELNGMNLVAVAGHVSTVSSSGAPTVQLRNVTDSVDMLSTKVSIDASEKDSSTAATAAVIDTSHDDVTTADEIAIDVDVAGTDAKGLIVEMTFQLP